MWNLGEYRKHPQRLADHLPWATFIAPGVMLNKDGSLQKTVAFRGPDLDSSTPYELVAARARMNNVLRRLGSHWCVHVEASRHLAEVYPASEFPNPVATERHGTAAFGTRSVRSVCAHLCARKPAPQPLSDLPAYTSLATPATAHSPNPIRIDAIS
jgi:type IV secretory pathway VirB4 component